MEAQTTFKDIDELVQAIGRERNLLKGMFNNRKSLSFRYEMARELAAKKDESLEFLRRHGVIRYEGDIIEMEDVYLNFFEEVLQVNEEINVASVKQSIESLTNAIEFYQSENAPSRKLSYLKDVKRILRTFSLSIVRSVIDLKRNIDNTYKNEPTFNIKKKKLELLDEKRKDISTFIKECERVIKDKHAVFFTVAMDSQLNDIVADVRYQLNESYHNLIELDRQIINYLNLIEYQSKLAKKIQKLKYLRDQLVIESQTDIRTILGSIHPVWMEPRPRYQLKVSLSMLRNSDIGLTLLREIAKGKKNMRLSKGNLADALSDSELNVQTVFVPTVDTSAVKDAFLASGDNLFHFIMNYSNYPKPMEEEDLLVVFCQVASQYQEDIILTNEYRKYKNIEYPIIIPRQ